MGALIVLILLVLLFLFVVTLLAKTVRIVPQARAGIVERFGKYKQTLPAGLNIVVPFIDKVRYLIDLREQVVSFPPQPVITEDNLVVSIDTVIYFQVTDPIAATYEIANYIQAVEQLTMTTLRNIVGGMDLEQTLTSREEINHGLRGVLDEATGKWGIRVNRVEIKGIDPPPSIKDAMEKQMRADRDKRALILSAEGQRQSSILTAEGNKQSAILNAEGDRESQILRAQADRESAILRAQGEGQAIQMVFQAIHDGQPDQALLAYQYLQMMPKIAEGDANKVWVIPSEITKALEGLGSSIHEIAGIPKDSGGPRNRVDMGSTDRAALEGSGALADAEVSKANAAVQAAIAEAAQAANPGISNACASRSAGRLGRPAPACTAGAARLVTSRGVAARSHRHRACRAGRGHHQHRGGVGDADHVPDPPRVRRTARSPPTSPTPSVWCRARCPAWSATDASSRGSAPRILRIGIASLVGGVLGAVLLLVLPDKAFSAIVPALVGLGHPAGGLPATHHGVGRGQARRAWARRRGTRCWAPGGSGPPCSSPACTAATSAPRRACC